MNLDHQWLHDEYKQACERPFSDISQHLPLLHNLANRCSHVTEFGVRWGESSRAILSSNAGHIRMFDLELDARVVDLVGRCKHMGKDVTYQAANVLSLDIEPTEFLFIDTLHTYQQLVAELERHSWKVSRYLAFHDTHTFGTQDEPGHGGPGLLPAILEFLSKNPSWRVDYHSVNNNGFTVLTKQTPGYW